LTLNASVSSTGGNITLLAKDSIVQASSAGDITASTSTKTIDLWADAGITMVDGALSLTTGGNIRYQATAGNITLAEISTGSSASGQVAILATIGSILDIVGDTAVDITAADLILMAGTSIGQSANRLETSVANLSSWSKAGGTYLSESDALTVTALSLTVNRVGLTGTDDTTSADTQQDLTTVGADSHLYLVTTAGGITVNAGTDLTDGINAAGNLLLYAGGGTSDITVNAGVTSAGHITVNAGRDLLQNQNANLTASADAKTIDIVAGNAITMAQGSATQSTASSTKGNIRLQATTGNITLEKVDAGSAGSVSIIATAGSILDGDVVTTADDTEVDIIANGLLLNAAVTVGAGTNHLEITVTSLTANATGTGASSTNGVYITETDGLTLGTVDVDVYRQASALDANFDRSIDFTSVVLPGSVASTLTVVVDGQAFTTIVASGSGLSTLAAGVADLASKINVFAPVDYTAGVDATSKIITITGGAGAAAISTTLLNVTSGATTISAADTGIALMDNAAQSNLTTANNGNIVLVSNIGNIDATNSVSAVGAGNVLLMASVGDLTLNNSVNGGSGNVSLISGGNQVYAAAGDVSTTAGTIEVQATGGTSTIGMLVDTVFQTSGGNIRLQAGGAITVGLIDARISSDRGATAATTDDLLTKQTDVSTPWGAVSITSSGGSVLDNASDTAVNVYANEFKLIANTADTGALGSGTDRFETEVARMSANVGSGGLFLSEATALTLGQTAAATVKRVLVNGEVDNVDDAAQDDFASAGALVVTTTAGGITTLSGSGDILAAGNVLLNAGGATSDITLGGNLSNTTGHSSVLAGRSVLQNANITSSGAGKTVDFLATAGVVTMMDGTALQTNGGNVRISAVGDITLGSIDARVIADRNATSLTLQADAGTPWGSVSLISSAGSIVDNDTESIYLPMSCA
jgi:hypothetical protein